jgi:chromosome segregation ATPase
MSEERLKRVEVLLETCAKMTVSHQSEIKELRDQVKSSSDQIVQLALHIDSLTQMFQESMAVIKVMQSQVKGIQTENKRILNHLFGESQE